MGDRDVSARLHVDTTSCATHNICPIFIETTFHETELMSVRGARQRPRSAVDTTQLSAAQQRLRRRCSTARTHPNVVAYEIVSFAFKCVPPPLNINLYALIFRVNVM